MKEGRTVTPEDVEAKKQAKRATDDAMDTLHKTAPVTMAGLERIPKGRNRGGFPNQVELWFILAAGLEASRDGEAFF
jgi:hypothetical protein